MEKHGLFQYLQDPHLVARFQHLCGVRSRFTKTPGEGTSRESDRLQAHQNGASCVHHSPPVESDILEETFQSTSKGLKKRINNPNVPLKLGEDGGKMSQNGAPFSAVKPLRKNSLTGDAGQEFIIENRLFYYLFTFGTELGNELFYITFFPFVIWNIDALVGRRIIMVWVWVMYLGQCTKDLLGWSRPASPPVVKVEMFYNSEYSMPSTHAMSGTAIPFALFYMTHGRWKYPLPLGLCVAVGWCVLVCVSRIYMGMHSVLDVLAGVLYSSLILLLFLPLLDCIDSFIELSAWAPLVVLGVPLTLAVLSFRLDAWSTSRGDTAQILGTGAGITLAAHVNRAMGYVREPLGGPLWVIPARLLVGVAVLVVTRAVMKADRKSVV